MSENKISQQPLRQPESTPNSGTRPVAGKSNLPTETFRDGKQPKPEAVTTIDPNANKGTAIAAGKRQSEGDGAEKGVVNGNPKKRTSNSFGVKESKRS
ncbi:MAG TPA: hypothetical protein VEW05_07805 [Candidatus Polarisedimenticolia bacterium]|nr:hypothetical protein [Candidatus Polarisedimenticolia bacterium]